jgi:cytochrome c553
MQSTPQSASVRKGRALVVLLALLGIFGTPLTMPELRWRAQAVWLQLTGRIPDLETRDLLKFIGPNSDQPGIRRLLSSRNPYSVIRVPRNADAAAGAGLFASRCASCHGDNASGADGPALFGRDFTRGDSDWSLYRTIHLGVPNSTMPAHALQPAQIWSLVAYIRSLDIANDLQAQSYDASDMPIHVDVPAAELAATELPADDWLTYSGSYSSARHSSLKQIDTSNVSRLAVRWIHQIDAEAHRVECSPLVRNGIMFITVPLGKVMALDAATGHTIWTHTHAFKLEPGGEGPGGQSRGVALLDDKVFYGTWDVP